jgi:hypothetical protein
MRLSRYPSANPGYQNHNQKPVAVKIIKLQDINTGVKKHLLDCEVAALSVIRSHGVCETYDILKDQ